MSEDYYCSFCGSITGFWGKKCIECERAICKQCLVRFKEIDDEDDDVEDYGEYVWNDQLEYCGHCAVSILGKRNKYLGRKIYCTNCENKIERELGGFCPKCGTKLDKGVRKKVKSVRNK